MLSCKARYPLHPVSVLHVAPSVDCLADVALETTAYVSVESVITIASIGSDIPVSLESQAGVSAFHLAIKSSPTAYVPLSKSNILIGAVPNVPAVLILEPRIAPEPLVPSHPSDQ